jgi:hypothetical protein
MRRITLLLGLSAFLLSLPALAQKCTEEFIRTNIDNFGPKYEAEDAYFFSGALEKPIVGLNTGEAKKTGEKLDQERKNEKRDPHKLDRIVVAPSGDMAYAFGTGHMSFDEVSTGKHVDFTAAFLTVWKVVNGSCKLAASMFEPEGEKN